MEGPTGSYGCSQSIETRRITELSIEDIGRITNYAYTDISSFQQEELLTYKELGILRDPTTKHIFAHILYKEDNVDSTRTNNLIVIEHIDNNHIVDQHDN